MPRPAPYTRIPGYCFHSTRNRGYVRLDGRVYYLPGAYGSALSRAEYDRLIAVWTLNGRRLPVETPQATTSPNFPDAVAASTRLSVAEASVITVAELCDPYLIFARGYYQKDGKPTTQVRNIEEAFRILMKLFADTPVAEFGPKKLALVRDAMIAKGWCRTTVIKHLSAVKAVFQWGTEQELVPGNVYHALLAVKGLRKGRSAAPESEPIQEIAEEIVEATLPHLSATVAAMVRVQLLTGMRPGEVCMMRAMDIKMDGDVWIYRPMTHKNAHHSQERVICIGPRARKFVEPFLTGDPKRFLFSSEESDHYTSASYRRAIDRACRRAFRCPAHLGPKIITPTGRKKQPRPESPQEWWKRLSKEEGDEVTKWRHDHSWHPNQLRHTAATRIRDQFAIDSAQIVLGHSKPTTTAIYASNNVKKAAEIMRLVG